MKLPRSNAIHNFHMMVCKQILGVQKQTTNIGVLLELERVPLNLYAKKSAIKNWERIRLKNSNTLVSHSHKLASENQFVIDRKYKKTIKTEWPG